MEWLNFASNEPLLFTDAAFWLFFAVVLIVLQFVHRNVQLRNLYLLGFSLYFYYLSSGWYFLLLLLSTVADYYLGKLIFTSKQNQQQAMAKLGVSLSVVVNLSLLAYFKYTFFFIESFNGLTGSNLASKDYLSSFFNSFLPLALDDVHIFLPVGISFYTFQTISYSVDVYRGRIQPVKSLTDFGFYVSFFPQLVAGPIVRASHFIPQLYEKFYLSRQEFGRAIYLIIVGLIKKMLIADYIAAGFVDRVFQQPLEYTGFANLMAVYGYTLQIYCDFSGYTDVAIGIALLLGFRLPLNFNSPYKAESITDFWRRWHISLSSWLRDYLYIPLGGNRYGTVRTYVHLFITMLLGGLWHGNSLRFVIWGALHGTALAVHKIWQGRGSNFSLHPLVAQLLTLHFVAFCWIFFRAESYGTVLQILQQIAFNFRSDLIWEVIDGYWKVFAVIGLGFWSHYLRFEVKQRILSTCQQMPDMAKALLLVAVFLLLYQVKSADIQPFIYFQF